jgi:nitrite reductase/ring-hydroxylating ferredoxin subunit
MQKGDPMGNQASGPRGPDLAAGVPANSLHEGVPLLGVVGGEPVILVRRGADIFAIGAGCTHYGGPLAEGMVVNDTVRCPWHHACFDLRTGEALRAPALNTVPSCQVVQRQGSVFVGPWKKAAVRPRASRHGAPSGVTIVGAGAAGNSAAETLRHLGFEGSITLIDADESAPYGRPNLSKGYLAGTAPESGCRRTPVPTTTSWR